MEKGLPNVKVFRMLKSRKSAQDHKLPLPNATLVLFLRLNKGICHR